MGALPKRQEQETYRVNLRLRRDTYEAVKGLAEHKGMTIAAFVQETIEGMEPGLRHMLATLDKSDEVTTVDQGVAVLEQLRTMAIRARSEANRLDGMVSDWQEQLRQEAARQVTSGLET